MSRIRCNWRPPKQGRFRIDSSWITRRVGVVRRLWPPVGHPSARKSACGRSYVSEPPALLGRPGTAGRSPLSRPQRTTASRAILDADVERGERLLSARRDGPGGCCAASATNNRSHVLRPPVHRTAGGPLSALRFSFPSSEYNASAGAAIDSRASRGKRFRGRHCPMIEWRAHYKRMEVRPMSWPQISLPLGSAASGSSAPADVRTRAPRCAPRFCRSIWRFSATTPTAYGRASEGPKAPLGQGELPMTSGR